MSSVAHNAVLAHCQMQIEDAFLLAISPCSPCPCGCLGSYPVPRVEATIGCCPYLSSLRRSALKSRGRHPCFCLIRRTGTVQSVDASFWGRCYHASQQRLYDKATVQGCEQRRRGLWPRFLGRGFFYKKNPAGTPGKKSARTGFEPENWPRPPASSLRKCGGQECPPS